MQDFHLRAFNLCITKNIKMITRMKTMKIWRVALAIFAAFSLVSCSDDPEGKWDPMIWKADMPVQATDGVYNVAATGAELTFSCRNYSHPWLEDAVSNGEYFYPPRKTYDDFYTITADWFEAKISENKLTVIFKDNDTSEERPLELTVTVGDIFHRFKFKQFAR